MFKPRHGLLITNDKGQVWIILSFGKDQYYYSCLIGFAGSSPTPIPLKQFNSIFPKKLLTEAEIIERLGNKSNARELGDLREVLMLLKEDT